MRKAGEGHCSAAVHATARHLAFVPSCPPHPLCHCAEETSSASMQTLIRRTPICTFAPLAGVAAYIALACQPAVSSPSMPVEDIDLLRRHTPLANVKTSMKTPVVVSHLRMPVLRRLYVPLPLPPPHGLPSAPCPMPTHHRPPELTQRTQKCVPCLLQPSSLSSPSAPCRASEK